MWADQQIYLVSDFIEIGTGNFQIQQVVIVNLGEFD